MITEPLTGRQIDENEPLQPGEHPLTREHMTIAAAQLAKSSKGRRALRGVLIWLDSGAISLDAANQSAVFMLLMGSWGPFAGSARDAIRGALELADAGGTEMSNAS